MFTPTALTIGVNTQSYRAKLLLHQSAFIIPCHGSQHQ